MVRRTNKNVGAGNTRVRTPALTRQVEEIRREATRANDRVNAYDYALNELRKDQTVLDSAVVNITRYLTRPWHQRVFGRLRSESPARQDNTQPEVEVQAATGQQPTVQAENVVGVQNLPVPRQNRLLRRPSWKTTGLVALSLGIAGVLGWGGCQIRNLVRDWPEIVYEGTLNDGEFRYSEGNKANTLEVQSGRYKFVFIDDDNHTSIKDGDKNAFGKDNVDKVVVERPGARKIVYGKGNEGNLYGVKRDKFMSAATKCYNGVRTAVLMNKRRDIQDVVDGFDAIGQANDHGSYKSPSVPTSGPSK